MKKNYILGNSKNSIAKAVFNFNTVLAFLFILFGISSSFVNAQVIVPAANTNDGSVNDPLGTWFGFERSAMIYTSAQIGTTGNITDVGFYVNSVSSPGNATNVRIYMKMRTTTFTANSTYATETTGATLVYGPTTITGASFAVGWNTVTLTTPFNYTGGTDNLEIIVETNATGGGNEGSTGKQFRYQTQGNNQYYQYWSKDTSAPTGNGTRSTLRPNVRLTFAAASVTPVLAITGTTAHGSVCPGTAATSQTYTITNTGTSAASGITVTSSNPTEFVVSSLSSTTVAGSGGTVTYVVTFTPSSTGPKTATITVTSTTAGSNSPTSSLTGTGATSVTPIAVTNTANNITATGARLRATAATTFGVCPNTTAKGFVYSVNSVNATPTIGGTGVTNVPVTPLGSSLTAYTFDITGLTPSTTYSYRAYLFDGTTYTYGAVVDFTTLTPTYCTPTSEGPEYVYIDDIRFMGTLNDVDNLNSGYTTGYQNFTALPKAVQAQGEGVNVFYYNISDYDNIARVKAWVDWNGDGDFNDVNVWGDPNADELVYDTGLNATSSATFGFIIPPTAPPGDYRIRIRNNIYYDEFLGDTDVYDFDACEDFDYIYDWFWDTYEYYEGEAEDYLFTVVAACNANIVTATNGERCGSGTVNLTVTGTSGVTGYNWYAAETGGTAINPTPTGTTWTTPILSTTTTYWVTATNGTCESLKRTKIVAEINPTPTVSFTPSAPVICGDTAILQLTAGGDTETVTLINENFEGGGLGAFNNFDNDGNTAGQDAITRWQNKISPYLPTNTEVWSPAISSGIIGNRFAMSTSDVNPSSGQVQQFLVLTTAVDATNVTGLTLTFDMYYSSYGDEVRVQVNNGSGWTTIQTYTASVGIGTRFAPQSISLPALYATSTLRIRIQFLSGWGDGVAVDNIKLFGERPLSTSFSYNTTAVAAFTDAGATIPYSSGTPATTIYIKPTLAQLELASFTIPVSATLSSGCSASGSVVVTNNTKMFTAGTAGTDWNNAANWRPAGIPTADNCVVIYDNDVNITGTNYTALGRNLTIKPTGNLNVASTNTALITDIVNVEAGGVFEIENDASLVQENNVANTVAGTFNSKRIAVTNSYLDYVYWSSPVAGFSINNITPSSTHRYAWSPTTATGLASDFGNWTAASGAMTTGRGYIVRGSSGNTTFAGVPNNGDITIPISRSTYMDPSPSYTGPTSTQVTVDDDNWNLLGNPYPSALSADAFLTANFTNLETFVKIWKHGIDPAAIADPFYQDYQLNYDTNDYLTFNRFGGTQDGFDGYIGSGQGFFVLMRDTGATTENAIFNNTMRSNLHRNDQFYRTTDPLDRHRIWIKIISPTNTTNDMLVGYAAEATNAIDDFYDTKNVGIKTNFELYSLIENKGHLIQARALPFDTNDQIPLGVKIAQNGIHTIAISAADGLFGSTTQDIYLEDRTLGITHDLRTVPYSFTATPGTYENRFVLKFNNETLGTNDLLLDEASVWVFSAHHLTVKSSKNEIQSVRVFDLLGRALAHYPNVNSMEVPLTTIQQTDSGLIIQVTLSNGTVVTKKTIY